MLRIAEEVQEALAARDPVQVRDVAVAADGAPGDHGEPPVGREVQLLHHDLAPDVGGCHRAAGGHERQGSRAVGFGSWPFHPA